MASDSDYDPNLTQHEFQTLAMNTDEFQRDVEIFRRRGRAYWALMAIAAVAALGVLTMLAIRLLSQ
jgi:hypothetical protein